MKQKIACAATILFLFALLSCKKSYNPVLSSATTNFLAVDGTIISGDSTFITLTRTTKLNDTTQKKVELKAVVSIAGDNNTLYALTEKGKGVYALGVTNFDQAHTYRLNIKTSDGKLYQSDFVPVKVTPPIDSVYFKQNSNAAVLFYVNTHDPTNNTRYYRWDYKETWSYVSLYTAYYQYKGGQIIPIVLGGPEDISTCYGTAPSNQIFVGSSATLANDIIINQPLGGIDSGSQKITKIYTMQLRQYALTKDGFNYYQNLKTNTEQLGTIFDPQPTTTNGNIHCITSPAELVLGFICASTVTTKQFNLHRSDLPIKVTDQSYGEWAVLHFYNDYYVGSPTKTGCSIAQITTDPYATFANRFTAIFANPSLALVDRDPLLQADAPGSNFLEPGRPAGIGYVYYYAPKSCVDCRIKGFTNIRPAYFPPF